MAIRGSAKLLKSRLVSEGDHLVCLFQWRMDCLETPLDVRLWIGWEHRGNCGPGKNRYTQRKRATVWTLWQENKNAGFFIFEQSHFVAQLVSRISVLLKSSESPIALFTWPRLHLLNNQRIYKWCPWIYTIGSILFYDCYYFGLYGGSKIVFLKSCYFRWILKDKQPWTVLENAGNVQHLCIKEDD